MTNRRQPRRKKNSKQSAKRSSRRLWHETLERRELLAADLDGAPRLIGVNPNAEEIFSSNKLNELNFAPTEVTFRFDGGQQIDGNTIAGGIRITPAGGDGVFDGDEDPIIPGFLGFGDNQQTVIARFEHPLPDDRYRIEVFGEDDTNQGITAIRNISQIPFRTVDGERLQTIDFDVELGGKVIAVVPQPVNPVDGTLVRADNQIDVYFDDADLFRANSNIGQAEFYQLVNTQRTVTTEDDAAVIPSSVDLFPDAKKVTLNFAPGTLTTAASTSFRLRIGDNADFETLAVTPFTPGADPGLATTGAVNVTPGGGNVPASAATNGSFTLLIDQKIDNEGVTALADNPGGNDEIGHRDIELLTNGGSERHLGDARATDNGIAATPFTFLRDQVYGNDANGDPLTNLMNAEQEARFREVLELYGDIYGLDFYETESSGLELIVGDLFTVTPALTSGPGGVLGLGNGNRVTMDYLDFTTGGDNQFGASFFNVALHEIGHAISLGHTYDLENSVQGPPPGPVDNVYPSPDDVVHGEYLHQKEALDVDLYRIDVSEPGMLLAQTLAERLANSSLLDTRLSIFREVSAGEIELVGANDDYFGSDSFLEIPVEIGTYFVGVSAEGNNAYDIQSGLTSAGGVSEGDYNLRLEFKPSNTVDTIIDDDGSALDGDRDGVAGGNYNFWFETGDTIYVRKPDVASDVGGDGSLTAPFDNIDDALAVAATRPRVIVRVVANDGADNDVTELADNEAYEIGFVPGVNMTLDDGRNVVVPDNTSLVIDAGVILKFLDSRISVGSDNDGVNRSGSSIQVLGTPQLPVYFTSYNDHSIGANANPNNSTPVPGNWGGIEIRNDVDRVQGRPDLERQGIFQNYINHASFAFGGGPVSTIARIIDPIQLSEARAEVSYNQISQSGNNAISADPNTFQYTTFVAPRFQDASISGNGFVADYDRVGPSIHGNDLLNNNTNALFVRIDTPPGGALEQLEVSARFDDTDIVHVLGENLLLRGQPGGPFQESVRPSPIIGLAPSSSGGLSTVYNYSYTFVDARGNESLGSAAQSVTVSNGGFVQLSGITAATGDFVARRLYRRTGGAGAYELIAELDAATSAYRDGLAPASDEAPTLDVAATSKLRGRPDATLIVDPGMIIKSEGAGIRLGFGATLIAEGNEGSEAVFTSINDDRYGSGGPFDTGNDGAVVAARGDWGGIYANRTSRVSLDHTLIAYGGGVAGVAGTTAGFNALEIHQAQARVANSRFQYNAEGSGGQAGANREGLSPNSRATIHVAGSQPIIVGNTFLDNGDEGEAADDIDGAVININVNALDSQLREDTGRQTGNIDLFEMPPSNNGPVIRGNELDRNDINGVEIRGGTLHTEVVLDDTDIVHVLRSDVVSTNFHTYNGFRLESSDDESLVIKLGEDTEILATGESLDITDRVGGRTQVLGTPGNPVIMTSLSDCTAGAGFTPDGQFQVTTIEGLTCGAVVDTGTSAPYADIIVVMDETITMRNTQVFSAQFIQDLEAGLLAAGIGSAGLGANRYGAVGFASMIQGELGRSIPVGAGGALYGTAAEYAGIVNLFASDGTREDGYAAIDFTLQNYATRPDAAKFIILASDEDRDVLDPAQTFSTTLVGMQNAGFNLQAIVDLDIEDSGGQQALAIDSSNVYVQNGNQFIVSPGGTITGGAGTTVQDYFGLVTATGGIAGDIEQIAVSPQVANVFSQILVSSIVVQAGGTVDAGEPGDWTGLILDPYSHDRNVDTTTEFEGEIGGRGDTNASIDSSQYLGQLAPDEFSGDENRRLGFTVFGAIAANQDQDIYSFGGTGGTMVWLDIDRTDAGLDTVLEFLDGEGNVLALSEDSRFETTALTYVNPLNVNGGDSIGLPDGHASPMPLAAIDPAAKNSQLNAQGGGVRDFYGLNDGDAGMRVVLPGSPGSTGTYYVRVRSSNPADLSDPAQIMSSLEDGRTHGGYQLQIRLREADELGGSVIRYADIRYASIGIEAIGLPAHSPLAGELDNNSGGTLDLGSFANTDRGAVSVSGVANATADSYTFTVGRDKIQNVAAGNGQDTVDAKVSAVIDVDFADRLTRPNTAAFLYHDDQLIAIGTESNVLDDRVSPTIANQTTNPNELHSGSFGPKDPFIGPLELSSSGSYEVVIATNSQVPPELLQFTHSNATNPNIRLEPLDSTIRIADDRFSPGPEPVDEQGPVAEQVAFDDDASNIVPWHIGDVPLIAFRNRGESSRVSIYNPLTGRHDAIIDASTANPIGAVAQSLRGDIIAIGDSGGSGNNDANTSATYRVNTDGTLTALGGTGIGTFRHDDDGDADPATNSNVPANAGMEFRALAFYNDTNSQTRFLYGVANRGTFTGSTVISDGTAADDDEIGLGVPAINANNLIYRLDPGDGEAIGRRGANMPAGFESANPLAPRLHDNNDVDIVDLPAETPWAGTNVIAQIQIPSSNGNVVELVSDINGGQFLLAFTDQGAIWQVDIDESGGGMYAAGDIDGPATLLNAGAGITDANGDTIIFEQVTHGPANYQSPDADLDISDMYFGVGTTTPGGARNFYAFNMTTRTALPVFAYEASSMAVDNNQTSGPFEGLFFSSLDQNLWHLSSTLSGNGGHGMPTLDNDARPAVGGGASLRFGFDPLNAGLNHLSNAAVDTTPDASDLQNFSGYNFLGGAHGVVQSNPLDLKGMTSEDLPTLYFTYLLDTQGESGQYLRVFVASEDNEWSLVATNNMPDPGGSIDWESGEQSAAISNYGDGDQDRRFVQPLFDSNTTARPGSETQFRQARIDLGPWAGQENVKIRFEFSTAGEARPDQAEIHAIPGFDIADGHTITITGVMPDSTPVTGTMFGDALPPLIRTFEFDSAANGTTTPGAIPIVVTAGMTVDQVRDEMQRVIANEIHYADAVPVGGNFSTNMFPVIGDAIRLYDLQVTQSTTGRPLQLVLGDFIAEDGVTDPSLPASGSGAYAALGFGDSPSQSQLVAAGNRSRGTGGSNGVYIDDIVIGLAERGESVGNAGTVTTPRTNLQGNPYFQPNFGGSFRPETPAGPYQIEVRLGREYANPGSGMPLQLDDYMEKLDEGRVGLNERLAEGLNLTVIHRGDAIADGDTFTISNGADTLTFEFNSVGSVMTQGNVAVDYDITDSEGEVARAIRDAINTISVNSALGILATNQGGQLGTETNPDGTPGADRDSDPVIVLHGFAAADSLGDVVDFGSHLTGTITGRNVVLGEDNGDLNLHRDQGQLLIEANKISFSENYGIVVDAGTTAPSGPFNAGTGEGNRPKPGAVQNFPTLNTAEQIPGAVIQNNLLYQNAMGGIRVSSDTTAGASSAFLRLLNNTVYGDGSGNGIRIEDNAAPALLNNVLMNNATGISVNNAGEILIRGTVYQGNTSPTTGVGVGTEARVNPVEQLFVNANPVSFNFAAGAPNFYPESGSPVVNTSVPFQDDRTQLVSVKDSVGLPQSPVLVPGEDLLGQTRGQQFFADRGATERLDDLGPNAFLRLPLDNDAEGLDVEAKATIVELASGRLFRFDIGLEDIGGTGPDLSTIGSDQITVLENGRPLIAGEDYVIGYSSSSGLLRLTPTSGEWRPDAVYVITLNNRDSIRLFAQRGEDIVDGDQLVLTDDQGNRSVFEYETGNALQVPTTYSLRITGANNAFADGNRFRITAPDGTRRTFEINTTGTVSGSNVPINLGSAGTVAEVRQAFLNALTPLATTLDLQLITVGDDVIQLGTLAGHVVAPFGVPAVAGLEIFGIDAGIAEGQQFSYQNAAGVPVVFQFTSTPTGPQDIPFSRTDTADEIAAAIATVLANQNLGLTMARAAGDGVVALGGAVGDIFDPDTSALTQLGSVGVTGSLTLEVTTPRADLLNDTFTVTVGATTQTFQFTDSPTLPVVGNRILLSIDNPTDMATAIAAALANAFPASLSPSSQGNVVTLGEQPAIIPDGTAQVLTGFDLSGTDLVGGGVSGGVIGINFLPTAGFTAGISAESLAFAIGQSPLDVDITRPGGGSLLLSGLASAQGVTAAGVSAVGDNVEAIKDLAGNTLLANQITGETRFIIVMPDVVLDFGDAPDTYLTSTAVSGARHAIVPGSTPRLGRYVDAEPDAHLPPGSDDTPINLVATGSPIFSIIQSSNDVQDLAEISVLSSALGGENITLTLDSDVVVFELVSENTSASAGSVVVPVLTTDTPAEIAASLVAAILDSVEATRDSLLVSIDPSDDTKFTILAIDDEDGLPVGYFDAGMNGSFDAGLDTEGIFLADASTGQTSDTAEVIGFLNKSTEDNRTTIPITVVGSGLLDAWIDFNGNGVFTDPLEHVFDGVLVSEGVNLLEVVTPSTAVVGLTQSRFRISTFGSESSDGIAIDGEVEDYVLQIFDIDVPNIVDDPYMVDEDTSLVVDTAATSLFFNDDKLPPAVDFVDLQYSIVGPTIPDPDDPTGVVYPTDHGYVRIDDAAQGFFTYVPEPDYYGPDEFIYFVTTQRNVSGGDPDLATVNITVKPVNDDPGVPSGALFLATEDMLGGLVISKAELLALALADATPMGQGFPQDESNQDLNVSAISTAFGTIDASDETASIMTSRRGTITASFVDGPSGTRVINELTYVPELNYNSQNFNGTVPAAGMFFDDGFDFTIVDDGISLDAVDPTGNPPQLDPPATAIANAVIRVTPQNDAPELFTDTLSISDPDFVAFYGGAPPTPTEDQTLIFPSDLLLQNDFQGPVGTMAGTDFFERAEDEISNYDRGDGILNDGALSVTGVRLIDDTLGSISLDAGGSITFIPADDVFGDVLFEYDVIDQGIDQPAMLDPGGNLTTDLVPPVDNFMTTTITSTIFLEPVNDAPVAYDRFLNLDEVVEADGTPAATVTFTADDLLIGNGPASYPTSPISVSGTDITVPDAATMIDGETLTITDATGLDTIVEFSTSTVPSVGTDVLVTFALNDSADEIAVNLQDSLQAAGVGGTAVGATVSFLNITAVTTNDPLTMITASAQAIVVPDGSDMIDTETLDIDVAGSAFPVVVEFNTSGLASPGTDIVVQYSTGDAAATIATNLQTILRNAGLAATANGNQVDLLSVTGAATGEIPSVPGDFAENLPAPYDESSESLRIVAFQTAAGIIDVDILGDGTYTLATSPVGGTLSLTFGSGAFVSGFYQPPVDYNERSPFVPKDLFEFVIADDGFTTLPPPSGGSVDLADERSLRSATVTLTVTETNDPPTFTTPIVIDILEDTSGETFPNVITNVLPGADTADDEEVLQTVTFEIFEDDVPSGLMTALPLITPAGGLTFFPAPDAVGTAVYLIRGTDTDPLDSRSTDALVTVNVRPVNDAPRINPAVAGTMAMAMGNPDDMYDVALDGSITYTLPEDNTQAGGAISSYFIPLARDPAGVGYNRIGLLDVFVAGPDNELDGTDGGDQVLELFNFPARSQFGGQLSSVISAGQLIGLNYVPPLDFNSQIGGFDEFTYQVRDDRPGTGETYSLMNGVLVPDRLTTNNRVVFALNPVNDRPEFSLVDTYIEAPEDAQTVVFSDFAFNINGGPPNTAFDETDVFAGQTVTFDVTPLDPATSAMFTQEPAIDSDGTLSFKPAADVYGEFEFEIVATDSGILDVPRGDLNSSLPVTITIDIQPINDPPVVDPPVVPGSASDPLTFELLEDGTVDILVNGDTVTPGLLDSFTPGPANESADIVPGGNQSVSLTSPIPATTAAGGVLTQIFDATGLTRFRYRPKANFVGTDSFIYTVVDDGVTVDINTGGATRLDPRIAANVVTLKVIAVNDAPQFSGAGNVVSDEIDDLTPVTVPNWATNVQPGPASATDEAASQNLTFEFTQLSTNTDLFAVPPSAVIVDDAATLSYVTTPDANGVATFEVRLRDNGPTDLSIGDRNLSNPVTFTIRVNAVNDPPSFDAPTMVTVDEDNGPYNEVWATNVSPGPLDESTQSVRFEVTTPPDAVDLFQSLPQVSDGGVLRFTPAVNANGTVDLAVRAIDSEGGTTMPRTLRIVINEINDPPIAVTDTIETDEDTVLVIPQDLLTENDIDPDLITNPAEMLKIVPVPAFFSVGGALVEVNPVTGAVTYDPTNANEIQSLAPNETLVDSFSYSVQDIAGVVSLPVTVTLNVAGINDAPVLGADSPTLNPNGPTEIPVLANDSDIDGTINPASIIITLQPAFGSLDINTSTGLITYTAFGSFSEEDQFRYTVADNLGARSAGTLVTIAANAAPVARDDSGGTYLDEAVDINVAGNDFDPDGQLNFASVVIVNPPRRGEAIPQADGTVRYVPAPGFIGRDSFQYTIADTEGRVSEAADVDVQVFASRLQNPDDFLDVNDDGKVTAIDALLVMNLLAAADSGRVPVLNTDEFSPPDVYYTDVNGDQFTTALDALIVINELSARDALGFPEAEQVSPLATPISAAADQPVESSLPEDATQISTSTKVVDAGVLETAAADVLELQVVELIADDHDADREARDIEALDAAFSDLL